MSFVRSLHEENNTKLKLYYQEDINLISSKKTTFIFRNLLMLRVSALLRRQRKNQRRLMTSVLLMMMLPGRVRLVLQVKTIVFSALTFINLCQVRQLIEPESGHKILCRCSLGITVCLRLMLRLLYDPPFMYRGR